MTRHVKYPRTPHVPWSPGASSDDRVLDDLLHLQGHEVVVTEKMDGENTSLYRDGLHARSLDSRHHPSRDWVAALHARIAQEIPHGWRICGENLYARHSVGYEALPSYFLAFSVWDQDNRALSWDDTTHWLDLLGLQPVPVLWRGSFDPGVLQRLHRALDPATSEGWVLRSAAGFGHADFAAHVAKWVRAGHVTSERHWMHQRVVPNGLRG